MIRLVLAVMLVMPATALAQGNPGPFGRLFGRSPAAVGKDETNVEIRSDVASQYDTALLAPEGQRVDSDPQSGIGVGGVAAFIFDHTSEKASANATGAASHQQLFREPQDYGVNRYSANAAASYRLTTRIEANASAGYGRSPSYQYMPALVSNDTILFDSNLMPVSPYALAMLENETMDGRVGITAELSRSTDFSAMATAHRTNFLQSPINNFESSGFRASLMHEIRRGLGVHAAYGRDHITPTAVSGTEYDNEVIDAGVDFNHALSLSRRTTLAFRTSTSVLRQTNYSSQFTVNGGISFAKFFRRTWNITAEANRTTQYLAGFVEPIYSDSVGVSLSGMFSKRMDFRASVSGGQGQYAFTGVSGFRTANANSRLAVALNRYMQVYAQYIAYLSEVPAGTTTIRLPQRLGRQAVAVGFGTYVPVYHKVRTGQ